MKTIWKFILLASGVQSVEMPAGAKVVSAAFQGETLTLWAEVDPCAKRVAQQFEVYATGEIQNIETPNRKFIGTVFLGSFVFHVYQS